MDFWADGFWATGFWADGFWVTESAGAAPTVSIDQGATAVVAVAATLQLTTTTTGSPTLAWASSDDLVATVNASGLVTGVADGTCTITVTATNGDGSAEDSIGLTIGRIRPSRVLGRTAFMWRR